MIHVLDGSFAASISNDHALASGLGSARRTPEAPMRIATIMLAAALAAPAAAEDRNPACEPGMLVFDASGSMKGTRIENARIATARVLPALTAERNVGLITYGGEAGPECGTIRLQLEPAPNNGPAIQAVINAIAPQGRTPLTEAVEQAAALLGGGKRRAVIVLVTDGEENCRGDPCALGQRLRRAGGRLKVSVIGYRLRISESSALSCLASETGGLFVEVSETDELAKALQDTLGCPPVSALPTADQKARFAVRRP
ncbi:MAG: VWA domain-containing protein [Hyphomicrobiaceae bacterium]|nr:MAG: VWA domain-containing protein [Hyphomicrobiaceae bacterium]